MMENKLIYDLLFLVGGIILLIISGDYLVKSGVGLAQYFKIPTLVIGLTVVAFGTSAPELIVTLQSVISEKSAIGMGNVIGSNIANIALVLALTVIILPMPVAKSTIKKSWPVMFFSGLVLYFSMYNGTVNRAEGLVMFTLLILFIFRSIRTNKISKSDDEPIKPKYPIWILIIMVTLSIAGLALGSHALIKGASGLALKAGVSERIISLTIVAFGTSIPELTASLMAAFRKEMDISVGNIVGSNIFNVYAVVGITSTIKPIPLNFSEFQIDLRYMLILFLLLFLFILPLKYLTNNENGTILQRWKSMSGGKIGRFEGIVLFSLYIFYIYTIL